MSAKPITIVGGGLAGLALGIGLRRQNIPVSLYESGNYPRHRVCGEFLSGVSNDTRQDLGIAASWKDAYLNSSSGWYEGGTRAMVRQLPVPALGLSRRRLDANLADRFRELGGDLRTGTRFTGSSDDGVVWASGRKSGARGWIGLKAHFMDLDHQQDLEMHFGKGAYVGISRIEEDKANVCGLFRLRRGIQTSKDGILAAYLQASGLHRLHQRLADATIVSGSLTTTASLDFRSHPMATEKVTVGDAYSAIPPFTGNGMSLALESAHLCLEPLVLYSQSEADWRETGAEIHRRLHSRFSKRLHLARALHPLLLHSGCRRVIYYAARTGFLPFHSLFRALR